MRQTIGEIIGDSIAFVVLGLAIGIFVYHIGFVVSSQRSAPTLAECLDSIQQVDNSATGVTEGDGIVYESFICETADYDYVITRDRRLEVQR